MAQTSSLQRQPGVDTAVDRGWRDGTLERTPQSQLLAGHDGQDGALAAGRPPPLTRQTEERARWAHCEGSQPGGDGCQVLASHLGELGLQV